MGKIMISIPDELLKEIDEVAKAEHRTRSEFFREAARALLQKGATRRRPIDDPRVKRAFESLRRINWKGKFDSTKLIRQMRDTRCSR